MTILLALLAILAFNAGFVSGAWWRATRTDR